MDAQSGHSGAAFARPADKLISPQVLRRVLGILFLAVTARVLIPDKMHDEVKTHGNYGCSP